jgi:hypothetical protein
MTYLVERLADLRRHLDHLRQLRPRVIEALDRLEPVEHFAAIVRGIEAETE